MVYCSLAPRRPGNPATPAPIQIKAGRKARGTMRQAYLWPIYGEADEIAFCYTPTRSGSHVRELLGEGFEGTLITDGYEAYARYAREREAVTHAECWAHYPESAVIRSGRRERLRYRAVGVPLSG